MMAFKNRLIGGALGCTWMLLSGVPVLADDSEIFVNLDSQNGARPNVLFIIDTSGSMASNVNVSKGPYNPLTDYSAAGSCRNDRVYYRVGPGIPPNCSTNNWFNATANHCKAATDALAGLGGAWTGKAAQFDTGPRQWRSLRHNAKTDLLECEADEGLHGSNGSPTPNAWPIDTAAQWTNDSAAKIGWGSQNSYTLYSGNWLNWYNGGSATLTYSRLEVVQSVATSLASSIDNVNLGLMRFSNNQGGGVEASAEGGMVTHKIADIATSRASIISSINSYTADGNTPLSETLYEAYQYMRGGAVDYGVDSKINAATPYPSDLLSRKPGNPSEYKSPIEFQCQKNVIILLTDGEPTADNSADGKITGRPGFAAATGTGAGCNENGPGRCLDELAGYMYNKNNVGSADLSPLPGVQNALTYTIGFGPAVAGSTRLQRVAVAGGTKQAYQATDITDLTVALQDIFREILATNTSFVTPSVAVNAFNRAESLNDIYVSVFAPKDTLRWPGNLKKYRFIDGVIRDANGTDAVGPNGFFSAGTQSFWSASPDGNVIESGGAASRLPAAGSRRLYTHFASAGNAQLRASANALSTANSNVTDAVMQTGAPNPTSQQVIDWLQGYDVFDADSDTDVTEQGPGFMGDPLHGRPAVVTYGQAGRDPNKPERDIVVFLPTNDGMLHAISGWNDTSSGGGEELWAFTPEELLPRMVDLYRNPVTPARTYGLDGDVQVLKFDINQNGVVDGSDKVYLFFGMRRGGRYYYALDVSVRNDPRLVWKLGPNELPDVGETWSTPTITRVDIGGASQNSEKFVLVFGGGYDGAQENYTYTADSVGNRIFMVDAVSGQLLWHASKDGTDLSLPEMTNSITGRVSVLDTNGDRFGDRMYASDLGGRLWRFDITNGNPRSSLVAGGVLAKLGAGGIAGATIADTRRFYYAPDVALIQTRGEDPYFNLAIGSGYRGHPLHKATQDYFFSVRDFLPFGKLTQAQYDSLTPILIGNLVDLSTDIMGTVVPGNAKGWRLAMKAGGAGTGEKVLAESVTANSIVLFTSYEPAPPSATDNPCLPSSKNRVYAIRVDSGKPGVNFKDDGVEDDHNDPDDEITVDDLYTVLNQKDGIVGEVMINLPEGGALAGVEVLKRIKGGDTMRTFWQRNGD